MKSVRNFLIGVVIIGSLAAGLDLLHAQTAVVGNFNGNLSLVQAAAPDSIVQITADAQGLSLVSPGQAPRTGTFWWILPNGTAVPAPCPPQNDLFAPIYQLAGGQFLVDQTGGQIPAIPRRFGMQTQATSSTALSGLEIEADTVLSLILRVQTRAASQQMRAMGLPMPGYNGSGDDSGDTNGVGFYGVHYTMPTNGLWLQLAGITNGLAYVDLHDVPNLNFVYEIFSRTNLSAPGWNIETEVFPPDTNQNMVTFTVPEWGRTNTLFVWARDWTGVDENGNGIPDWWEWKYFGEFNEPTNGDYDGDTVDNLTEYLNPTDPNKIRFNLNFTNTCVNTGIAYGTITISGGVPSSMAVLVNDDNLADATWQPYNPTVAVPLHYGNGSVNVWVGLRGRPSDAQQSWQLAQLGDTLTTFYEPSPAQTCPGTSLPITLYGNDNCGEDSSAFSYTVLVNPANGVLLGTAPYLTYSNTSPTFTGMDGFTYKMGALCGAFVTNTVTITVGDSNISANPQTVMTGTNQPVNITLTANSPLGCTNSISYTVLTAPVHGTNSGTPPNLTYTPTNNFEGMDYFTFTVSDGVWSNSATDTIFVVAGPVNLTAQCDTDGHGVLLVWSLDDEVQQMINEDGLPILCYRIYRSATPGEPFVYINSTDINEPFETSFWDSGVAPGDTNYYSVTFQYRDESVHPFVYYESPHSNIASAGVPGLSPIRPGFDQYVLPDNDDKSTGSINLPMSLKFFGTTYSQLFVNNNGNVTFGGSLEPFTSRPIVQEAASDQLDIIAPFWADVDTRAAGSGVVTFGTNTVNGHAAFGVTWPYVGYYYWHDDKTNVFQLVLIDRPDRASGDYDVEFNYAHINWEAGDASGGEDGLWTGQPWGDKGFPARAGFASASGSSFEIGGSGIARAFLDTNPATGLIYASFNSSNVLGRCVFQFHNGAPLTTP